MKEHGPGLPAFHCGPQGAALSGLMWTAEEVVLSGCLEQVATKEKGRETP